jgi:hypothetical protein
VPRAAVGMHEEDDIGELVVVVNYIGEIDLDRNVISLSGREAYYQPKVRTIASRPLFFGTLFSASGLSTS